MASQKPLHRDAEIFVRHHLGRQAFAGFTGTDYPAWRAFCYLVQAWCSGGSVHAIDAMRAALRCAQAKKDVWEVFVQAIPAVADWCHVRELWPQVVEGIESVPRGIDIPQTMCALQRGSGDEIVRRWGLGWP